MTRTGYDCTGSNAHWLASHFVKPEVVFWYATGSPGIMWTPAEEALFPDAVMIAIDQGFTGSPVPHATVRDVERGAWTPHGAVDRTDWTAERPTIYCNRTDLVAVQAAGWTGDVWLAEYDNSPTLAGSFPGVTIVAKQYATTSQYDVSSIYDDTWPGPKVPPPPHAHLSVTVTSRVADMAFNSMPGAQSYRLMYHSTAGDAGTQVATVMATPNVNSNHLTGVHVPGNDAGLIICEAIVDGKVILNGSAILP